ncbi:hypothetical protein M1615_04795 [Patescibacteria group bacterium]|nr:hypothetical protein [Patescibacteria group bacterium]
MQLERVRGAKITEGVNLKDGNFFSFPNNLKTLGLLTAGMEIYTKDFDPWALLASAVVIYLGYLTEAWSQAVPENPDIPNTE